MRHRAAAVLCAVGLLAAACGSDDADDDGADATADAGVDDTTDQAEPTADTGTPDADGDTGDEPSEPADTAGDESEGDVPTDDGGENAGAAPSGTLRFVSPFTVNSLNPHDDQTPATFSYYAWLYEGLVRQAVDGSIVPWLAESWETNEDGTAITFHLNDGVTFSDGTPFDAEAVKANIEFVKTAPPEQVIPPVAGQLGLVEEVEVVDPLTVQLHLSAPGEVLVLSGLARNSGLMVSPAALGDAANNPIGTGPYVHNADESAVDLTQLGFDANPTYWRPGEVGAEHMTITAITDGQARLDAFNAGQYDIVVQDLALRDGTTRGSLQTAPTTRMGFVVTDWLGEKIPQLANREVRCAMAQAVNRAGMQAQMGDPGSEQIQFATGPDDYAWIDDLEAPEFDIDAAVAAFEATGEEGFEFRNGHLPDGPWPIITSAWAGALNELGITMLNENLDPPSGGEMFGALSEGRYPVQIIPFNEPNALMSLIARTGTAAFNPSGVSPDGVDELVASARTKSMEDGEADVAAAWKIMLEECVWIIVNTLTTVLAVGDNVTGVEHVRGIPNLFWPQNVRVDG